MGFHVSKVELLKTAEEVGFDEAALQTRLRVCQRQLQRVTHDLCGCAPKELLNDLRMKAALRLLKKPPSKKLPRSWVSNSPRIFRACSNAALGSRRKNSSIRAETSVRRAPRRPPRLAESTTLQPACRPEKRFRQAAKPKEPHRCRSGIRFVGRRYVFDVVATPYEIIRSCA
jgi:hypothetical protein